MQVQILSTVLCLLIISCSSEQSEHYFSQELIQAYENYQQPPDTNYSIMDIPMGGRNDLYYAVKANDTSFVERYIQVMDTVDFATFYGMSVIFSDYVFYYVCEDYYDYEHSLDQVKNKNEIRYNCTEVYKLFFKSCHFMEQNQEKWIVEDSIYSTYGFFDRKLTNSELEEIYEILNSSCNK